MQHAATLSGEEDDQVTSASTLSDVDAAPGRLTTSEPAKLVFSSLWSGIKGLFHLLRPSTIRNGYQQFRQMTFKDMIKSLFALFMFCLRLMMIIMICTVR
jgi:hypothetical protein